VRLTGEDDLYRAFWVIQYPFEPFEVLQDQSGALVGGEPPGKAYCQGVFVEDAVDFPKLLDGLSVPGPLFRHPSVDEVYHLFFHLSSDLPQLSIRYRVDAIPIGAIQKSVLPLGEVFVKQASDVSVHPRLRVDPIGDIGDRYFVRGHADPVVFPQVLRHSSVQAADAILPRAEFER